MLLVQSLETAHFQILKVKIALMTGHKIHQIIEIEIIQTNDIEITQIIDHKIILTIDHIKPSIIIDPVTIPQTEITTIKTN